MTIAVASDHAGYDLKRHLLPIICQYGRVKDLGAFNKRPSDYPDFARRIAKAIQTGQATRGVFICGSGVGASVAANKFIGIRAALCQDIYSAHQGVEHDDVNVLCLGARVVGVELAKDLVAAFLKAKFSVTARHRRRVNKIKQIERENLGARQRVN